MNCGIPSDIVSLEIVQKLVSELENRDLRTLPQLPHRIILPGAANALVRSDSGDHFYQLSKDGNTWSCSCRGYQYRQYCKHSDGVQSYLNREEASQVRAASLLLKDSAMTEAQRYQAKKRAAIAKARANPNPVDLAVCNLKPMAVLE